MKDPAKTFAVTIGSLVLAIVCFSTPLILKFNVYRSTQSPAYPYDLRLINNRISTVWCQGQCVSSDDAFDAFLFPNSLRFDNERLYQRLPTQRMILSNNQLEYRAFFLPEGSSVTLKMCSRLPGAVLSVIKGTPSLKRCTHYYNNRLFSSEESLESNDESKDITSSISSSQGVFSNETNEVFVCHEALEHVPVTSNARCKKKRRLAWIKGNTVTYDIAKTDYYYFFVTTDTLDLIPNEISIDIALEKPNYKYDTTLRNCTNATSCEFPFNFDSSESVVVSIPPDKQNWNGTTMTSTCIPRKSMYFVFFASVPVLLLICAFQ